MGPHDDHHKGVGCGYYQVQFICTGLQKGEVLVQVYRVKMLWSLLFLPGKHYLPSSKPSKYLRFMDNLKTTFAHK